MTEPSIFDERLAEIDRRLRTIQSELRDEEPAPTTPAPQPAPSPAEVPGEDLLARLQRTCEALERALHQQSELLGRYADALAAALPGGGAITVPVAAGPFADADAVRAFESALRALPAVRGAVVREYDAGGRVTIAVSLGGD